MYMVGQSVVHLSHGVGTIRGIETRDFGNGMVSFYIVEIVDNGAPKKVFVPTNNSTERLRPLVTQADFRKVIAYLSSKENPLIDSIDYHGSGSWNRRYRAFMEDLHTGMPMRIAKVLKALDRLQAEKELSFGERLLKKQALELLSREFAAVNGEPQLHMEIKIATALGESYG